MGDTNPTIRFVEDTSTEIMPLHKFRRMKTMPASFCHLAVHIIFTTKNHKTWIEKPVQAQMHSYLAGIINNIGGVSIKINGFEDHVHILCLLPKDLSIGEFMAKIIANSSKWLSQTHCPEFGWQDGYAAFSVSKSNLESCRIML